MNGIRLSLRCCLLGTLLLSLYHRVHDSIEMKIYELLVCRQKFISRTSVDELEPVEFTDIIIQEHIIVLRPFLADGLFSHQAKHTRWLEVRYFRLRLL